MMGYIGRHRDPAEPIPFRRQPRVSRNRRYKVKHIGRLHTLRVFSKGWF